MAGYNYNYRRFADDHKRVPARVFVATETFPAKSFDNWVAVTDHAAVTGDFIWTAIDYIGEAAIGAAGRAPPDPLACGDYCGQPWAYHLSSCGDIDIVGGQRAQAHLHIV